MTAEMRNCLKSLRPMFNGLRRIEPGDAEYADCRKATEAAGIRIEDLRAWAVADFKNRRPPTEARLRAMLRLCRNWDPNSNVTEMRFSEDELDAFETAINDYAFHGDAQGGAE